MSATIEEIDGLIAQLKNIRARIGGGIREDLDMILARDIVAIRVKLRNHNGVGEFAARAYRKGEQDASIAVQSTLAGIKAGRRLVE